MNGEVKPQFKYKEGYNTVMDEINKPENEKATKEKKKPEVVLWKNQ